MIFDLKLNKPRWIFDFEFEDHHESGVTGALIKTLHASCDSDF